MGRLEGGDSVFKYAHNSGAAYRKELVLLNAGMPLGLFIREKEFVANPDGDTYQLRDIAA